MFLRVFTLIICLFVFSAKHFAFAENPNSLGIVIGDKFKTKQNIDIRKKILFIGFGAKLTKDQEFEVTEVINETPKRYKIILTNPKPYFSIGALYISDDDLSDFKNFEPINLRKMDTIRMSYDDLMKALNPNHICEGGCDADQINGMVKSVRPPNPLIIETPLAGARRVMQAFYQDCTVTENVIKPGDELGRGGKPTKNCTQCNGITVSNKQRFLDPKYIDAYTNKHFYLSKLKNRFQKQEYPKANCENILETPTIYAYGASCKVENGELKIHRDLSKRDRSAATGVRIKSAPVVGLDCAEFIGASFAAAGLKLYPNQKPDSPGTSTQELYGLKVNNAKPKKNPNTCFHTLDFIPETIKPGDVVSCKAKHTFMIHSVGDDPFGIEKTLNEGRSCREITAKDFDFTYIHSGDMGSSLGVSIVQASFHGTKGNSTTMITSFVNTARKICDAIKTKKSGKKTKMKLENITISSSNATHPMVVLRHLGNAKPECSIPKNERLKIEGEKCVQYCM